MLTNTEFVTGIIVGGSVFIVCLMVAISALVTMFILEWREDRRYLPRHSGDTLTWVMSLPPWEEPERPREVPTLVIGAMEVAALLWAVQRAELLYRVPMLQPSWVKQAQALCEREAGLLGERVGDVARAERARVREAGQVESRSRGPGADRGRVGASDGTG